MDNFCLIFGISMRQKIYSCVVEFGHLIRINRDPTKNSITFLRPFTKRDF